MSTNASIRTKILAYLGQLTSQEYASSKRICLDLDLRFTSAKTALTQLESERVVEKKITHHKGTVASFRIHGSSTVIPPDWEDSYGKHPRGI